MNQNNVKQKRNNSQKSSNTNHKVFGNSKVKISSNNVKPTNSKIIFDDDGNQQKSIKKKGTKRQHSSFSANQTDDVTSRWYEEYAAYNTNEELLEMKEQEVNELASTCKTCFENELAKAQSKNPTDSKWLEIALHKGTSKDRANAGALLVQTNPLANLSSLEKLIGLTKISNKTSSEATGIITELFISALLSPDRKLLSIPLRGADWKELKKNNNIEKSVKDRILAAWHFEGELKEQYYEFLRNMQAAIQGNQDNSKNHAIVCTAKLLCYSPEKEQMLLSMLVNKLGDPSNVVASKALHHLTEVAYKHPAMCEVIAKETEKLLFRNNITEHAQHFALCFLAQIAPRGNVQLCTKLVDICFSFFKVMVQKGAVNSKTMHAILRCLKRAIVDATTEGSDGSILTKDIQDTMYRLIHLADIHIALQTFALLLQIMAVKSGKYDRYYNALYKKMLDINLVNVGPKAAAQFLHIFHRSTYMDANVPRAQAFIKRLLQVAMYFPTQISCGCLIVVDKLLKSRPELSKTVEATKETGGETTWPQANEESDDEEHYKDADADESDENTEADAEKMDQEKSESSWHHAKNLAKNEIAEKVTQIVPSKYNPYQRTPAFAGAEFVLKTELLKLADYFHPSLKVFAKNLIDEKPISFYGDPLRDFCLTQFLDRFAFRNPKKPSEDVKSQSMVHLVHNKNYTASGGRGLPVKELTTSNCSEDEKFILEYLQQKREKRAAFATDAEDDDVDSVNDDEFDAYLDGLGGKDDDLDFMNDLGNELKDDTENKKDKKKKQKVDEDKEEENDGDWDDEDVDDAGDGASDIENDGTIDEENDSDDDGSISLGDDSDDDASVFDGDEDDDENIFEESDPEDEPKSKKLKGMSGKDFQKTLKNTDNMNSLFAAAEDFAEMLEETGKSKTHGTLGDIFNKDKSSEKQLNWEQKRFKSNNYSSKKQTNRKFVGNKKKSGNKKKF